MKTLKLLIVSAVLGLILSSCFKSEHGMSMNYVAYIRQYGFGTEATFLPNIRVVASEPIKSATAKWGDLTFPFNPVGKFTDIVDMGYIYGMQAFDSIPNGTYVVNVISSENKNESFQLTFNTKKYLGELKVNELIYDPLSGISAKWAEVNNATKYYMAYRYPEVGGMWLMAPWNGISQTEGKYNYAFENGISLQVAVAASTDGGIVVIGDPITIKWGGDKVSLY